MVGGSRSYMKPLVAPFADRIRLESRVQGIRRHADRVEVSLSTGTEEFDEVVLATHSDQALALLEDPSEAERQVLSAIPYQENEAVLHTDTALLPRAQRAWAAWNYHVLRAAPERMAVT